MRILRHVVRMQSSCFSTLFEDLSYHLLRRLVTCLDALSTDSIAVACFAFF